MVRHGADGHIGDNNLGNISGLHSDINDGLGLYNGRLLGLVYDDSEICPNCDEPFNPENGCNCGYGIDGGDVNFYNTGNNTISNSDIYDEPDIFLCPNCDNPYKSGVGCLMCGYDLTVN